MLSAEAQLGELAAAAAKRMSAWGVVEMDARHKFDRLLRHGLDLAFAKATPIWPPKVWMGALPLPESSLRPVRSHQQ